MSDEGSSSLVLEEPGAVSSRAVSVVVVTGLSGAGKSTALNALEDLGFFCIDNLPPPVFLDTIDALKDAEHKKIAVCMDVRARKYLPQLGELLVTLMGRTDLRTQILYLDAPRELLTRRYSATRRPHPLSQQSGTEVRAVMDGIVLEGEMLAPLRGLATHVLDTAGLTVHDLRRQVLRLFAQDGSDGMPSLLVRIVSFGFKYGVPHDADMMFDVRFLPNPYFVPGLRALSGKDVAVSDYVTGSDDCMGFMDRVLELVHFCIPRFEKEGKSYLTVAIGCTGGRHRSVALSEWLHRTLRDRLGIELDCVHRDMGRAEHIGADAQAREVGQSSRWKNGIDS